MKNRRDFIKKSSLIGAASIVGFNSILNAQATKENTVIKPKRLKPGATIGLIAPGYAVKPVVLENIKSLLIKQGFIPYHTDRILTGHGYFSNTDNIRALEVNRMFANKQVDAILCARGGYGCTRILPLLDYDIIKDNPKILLGFSDITALTNAIYKKTGLIGFHGPVGSTINDEYSLQWINKVLINPTFPLTIKNANYTTEDPSSEETEAYKSYTITSGSTSGILIGGSLSLVNAMIGTDDELDFTNAIVCLEDVGEAPYRIDRMLTQLLATKTFSKAKAIVFGICNDCDKTPAQDTFTLKQVVLDRIKPLGIPAAYGLTFGHIKQQFTFPVGIQASFNADQGELTLLEAAVV